MLPIHGLIKFEFRRRFEGRFATSRGLTGGLIPVEGVFLGRGAGRSSGNPAYAVTAGRNGESGASTPW
ncbi:MAG: hypothetical protein AB1648_13450 [Pseudomonadota bacterium]